MSINGVDVAHYQGVIDWRKVKQSGIDLAIAKVSQSTQALDPMFKVNRSGMRQAGFKWRGFYHWLSPNTDPVAQARWFCANLMPMAIGEWWMLDLEQPGCTATNARRWCDEVQRITGRTGIIYTSCVDTLEGFKGHAIWNTPTLFAGHGRILAAYTSEAKARQFSAPYAWDAWQFTSKGTVPGIPTLVDLDRVDHIEPFDRAAGYTNTLPPVTITPEPYNYESDGYQQ